MSEETLSQVALNAKAFSRDEDDEESALHSNWGSDESDTECHGNGRPRDGPDELPVEPQALDEHQGLLLPQSGAQAPDFIRGTHPTTPPRQLIDGFLMLAAVLECRSRSQRHASPRISLVLHLVDAAGYSEVHVVSTSTVQ